MALNHLTAFQSYHGFDPDRRAIRNFCKKSLAGNVFLYPKALESADIQSIRPTKALLLGLLHHVSSAYARDLFPVLNQAESLNCIVTLDPVRIRGNFVNELLCRLDRGRYVRSREGYLSLVRESDFDVRHAYVLPSGNGLASYFCMCLERGKRGFL